MAVNACVRKVQIKIKITAHTQQFYTRTYKAPRLVRLMGQKAECWVDRITETYYLTDRGSILEDEKKC